MRTLDLRLHVVCLLTALVVCAPSPARAVGESQNGFPSWAERVVLEWMNRARADPQVEMQACGSACADGACYQPIAPLAWDSRLAHSARFHSDEMTHQNYFAHDSICTVVSNIDSIYPASCDGSATCACEGGTAMCGMSGCTNFAQRVQLFGAEPSGEIIAGGADPNDAFYEWLFEPFAGTQCAYTQGDGSPGSTNGHRWNILMSMAGVGVGLSGSNYTGDFSYGGSPAPAQIPSGAHYPQQGDPVDAWASWYDSAGPKSALVDVDGTCTPMTLARGSTENGAYHASISGVGSGCHRYFFLFHDSAGQEVTYPTTGSLGIGPGDGSCADWDSSRPADCSSGSDGGVTGGPDGGAPGSDGGTGPGGATSSGCDLGGHGAPAGALVLVLLFAVALRRRAA